MASAWMSSGLSTKMNNCGIIPPTPTPPADLPANNIMERLLAVHNMDQPEVHPMMQRFRQLADSYPGDRVLIGELWGEWDSWLKYYGAEGDEIHLPFNFRLMWEPWEAGAMRRLVNEFEQVLPPLAWPNYVLGNHDQPRFASRFGGRAQARVAAMLLLTLRGTPTWYYGDELGMENVPIPLEKIQDPQAHGLGAERTRDVARTPMQWDDSPNAGFSPAGVETWLPLAGDFATENVAAQRADPRSMLSLVRELLALRQKSAALQGGDYLCLNEADPDCFLFARQDGATGECWVVALNFTGEARDTAVTHPTFIHTHAHAQATCQLSTYLDQTGQPINLQAITLRPHEGVILRVA
jgi:alpha-glucosidase